MNNLITKMYARMPVFLQNIGISLYGFGWHNRRMGGCFSEYVKQVNDREFYSFYEWRNFQNDRLRKLVLHAWDNVEFYREKYTNAGIDRCFLEDITVDSLKELPMLTKDELRKFGETTMLAKNKNRGIFIKSSGSTGTPTSIYMSRDFHRVWSAIYEGRVRKWAGVNCGMARGMIGGRRIIQDSNLTPPFYRYNIFEKQTYFSAYHITPNTIMNYYQGLVKNEVEYMVGYAMSNFILADMFDKASIVPPQMKAVITSSEKLTEEMRECISRVYRCKVYDSYSGCEACGLISQTNMGDMVVSPDAGIMEFLKEDGSDAKEGEVGEIVSTGLWNLDQPLIRYRIGDLALLSSDQEVKSGHNMVKIDEIVGRLEDTIIGSDGRKMVRFHGIYLDIAGLLATQLIQVTYDKFVIKMICDDTYIKNDGEEKMLERMISQLGNVSVDFEYLDRLPVEKNGKVKAIISLLS